MDLKIPKHHHAPPVFQSNRESPLEGISSNPFAYTFLDHHTDPLCKLNLKETADFVKAFPMSKSSSSTQVSRAFLENPTTTTLKGREETGAVAHRRLEAPPTPGRPPVFTFNGVVSESMRSPICNFSSRKSFPSKWDDAQKWLINSSSHESPHTHMIKPLEPFFKQNQTISHQKKEIPAKETSDSNGFSSDVLLKDKFTDNVVEKNLQNFRYPEVGMKEGFLFRNSSCCESMKDACTEVVAEVQHRDIGTEMTPLGSSTTSRCHTPLKSSSPARHNTPTTRSGPLVSSNSSIDISGLQDCYFAQFQAVDKSGSCWSSREEEEEDISKSLRHFEIGTFRKSVDESQSRATAWEDEERTKCCIRWYQREEAKIQAWVNLQSAKAEAQSRKLEVKIEKMRSNLEEKLMKRMAVVHRKAEEWRASAQLQHTQQMPSAAAASEQSQKLKIQSSSYSSEDKSSCGCFFPCNSY